MKEGVSLACSLLTAQPWAEETSGRCGKVVSVMPTLLKIFRSNPSKNFGRVKTSDKTYRKFVLDVIRL
jgi:hypothetical protein